MGHSSARLQNSDSRAGLRRPVRLSLRAFALGVLMGAGLSVAAAPPPTALPEPAANFAAPGVATTAVNGAVRTVTQNADRAVLNWKRFDVGRDARVQFIQPGADAVAYNKIHQADPSQIYGRLDANGHLYLVNPNGFIFGEGARVNARAFMASTLGVTEEALEQGLLNAIGQRLPALRRGEGFDQLAEAVNAQLPDGLELISVLPGAELTTRDIDGTERPGGFVMLIGTAVENQGRIEAPDGQAILAASRDKVYLARPENYEQHRLFGMLIEVDVGDAPPEVQEALAEHGMRPGEVVNRPTGIVETPRGNATLMGMAVNQSGIVRATTAVDVNGSIRLVARQTDGQRFETPNAVDTLALPTEFGEVTVGAGSLSEVVPDLSDLRGAVDSDAQLPSRVEVMGREVSIEDGARLVARGGEIEVLGIESLPSGLAGPGAANLLWANQITADRLQESAFGGDDRLGTPGVRVKVGEDVVFDASGLTPEDWTTWVSGNPGAGLDAADNPLQFDMSRNLETFKLLGFELRDAPVQRDNTLYPDGPLLSGLDVTFDVRRVPEIGDFEGAVLARERTVAERSTVGGTVGVRSSGELVVGQGTVFDVRGGSIEYRSGSLGTTKLVRDGRVYDIADAPSDLVYDRAFTPGVDSTEMAPTFEPGYLEGKDAGRVELYGNSLASRIEGRVVGGAPLGRYQREPATAAGGVSRAFTEATWQGGLQLGRSDEIHLSNAESADGAAVAVAAGGGSDAPTLFADGLEDLEILAGTRLLQPAGETLRLRPGGDYRFSAPQVEIAGGIHAPSAQLIVEARPASYDPTAASRLDIGSIAGSDPVVVDVSGQLINETGLGTDILPPLQTDAGTIELTAAGDLVLGAASWLRANAGGRIHGAEFDPGAGGSISIAVVDRANRSLRLEGALEAFVFDGGHVSSLELRAPGFRVEAGNESRIGRQDGDASGRVILGDGFFGAGGFTQISLTSDFDGIATDAAADIYQSPAVMLSTYATGLAHGQDPAQNLPVAVDADFAYARLVEQGDLPASADPAVQAQAVALLKSGSPEASQLLAGLGRRQLPYRLDAASGELVAGGNVLRATERGSPATRLAMTHRLTESGLLDAILQIGNGARLRTHTSRVGSVGGCGLATAACSGIWLESDTSIFVDGLLSAPGGYLSAAIRAETAGTQYYPYQAMWIGESAVLDVRARDRTDVVNGQVTGVLLDAGMISLAAERGYLAVLPGADFHMEGASQRLDRLDGSDLAIPLRVGDFEHAAPGSLLAEAAEGLHFHGKVHAGIFGDADAVAQNTLAGGSVTLRLDGALRGSFSRSIIPPPILPVLFEVGAELDPVPGLLDAFPANGLPTGSELTGRLDLRGLTESGVDALQLVAHAPGEGQAATRRFEVLTDPDSGLPRLSAIADADNDREIDVVGGAIAFLGDTRLAFEREILLDAQSLIGISGRDPASVSLQGAYVALGAAYTNRESAQLEFVMDQLIAEGRDPNDRFDYENSPGFPGLGASGGEASLDVEAGLIDLTGLLAFQGFGGTGTGSDAPIHLAAERDIRFRGIRKESPVPNNQDAQRNFRVMGRLEAATSVTLSAGDALYPTLLSDYFIDVSEGTLTFTGAADAGAALRHSAGAVLAVRAPRILQDAALIAPFGTISLHGLEALELTGQSQTSTSGSLALSFGSALETDIPFGTLTVDGFWAYDFGTVSYRPESPPAKRIELRSDEIRLDPGALLDVSGGSTLEAARFVFGPSGSTDILQNAGTGGAFAILPLLEVGVIAPELLQRLPAELAGRLRENVVTLLPGDARSGVATGSGALRVDDLELLTAADGVPTDLLSAGGETWFGEILAVNPFSAYAPWDPAFSPDFSYPAGTYLEIPAGPQSELAPGRYAVLPARYALVSGALLVTPTEPNVNLAPGDSFVADDAVVQLLGRLGTTGTAGTASSWSHYRIEDRDQLAKRAEYLEFDADTYFTARSAEEGAALPELSRDSGSLELQASTNLLLEGSLRSALTGGLGPRVDIAGERITVSSSDLSPPGEMAAGIQLTFDQLQRLGADSLLVGGVRRTSGQVTEVSALARQVEIVDEAANGTLLEVPELLLVATEGVHLGSGVTLASRLGNFREAPAQTIVQVGESGAAVVALSERELIGFQGFADFADPDSRVEIDDGVLLSTVKSLAMLADRVQFSDGAELALADGSRVALGSSLISVGDSVPDGLALDGGLLSRLATARQLDLRAGSLEFIGDAELAAVNLEISTPVLRAAGGSDGAIIDVEGVLRLVSPSTDASLGTGETGAGGLSIAAASIDMEGGWIQLSGFADATLDTGSLVGYGDAGITTSGAMAVFADSISTADAGTLALIADGVLEVSESNRFDEQAQWQALGGRVDLRGDSVSLDSRIWLPSGEVSVSALGDGPDTRVRMGDAALVDTRGVLIEFDPLDSATHVGTPGGTLTLQTATGDIEIGAAGFFGFGAGTQGDGGALRIEAPNGAVQVDADAALFAGAAEGRAQGDFSLLADSLDGGLSSLNGVLERGGFRGSREVRVRQGDLELGSGETLTAAAIRLVADSGAVRIDGALDAAGLDQGAIALFGAEGIELGVGGQILAGQDGRVELELADGATASSLNLSGAIDAPLLRILAPRGVDNAMSGIGQIASTGHENVERIELVGLNVYEMVGSGSVHDAHGTGGATWSLGSIEDDNQSFMSAANTQAIAGRLGLGDDSRVNLMPGVEIRSPGTILVDEDLDLFTWRYAHEGRAQAGVLRLRAAADLIVGSNDNPVVLGDGFDRDALNVPMSELLGFEVRQEQLRRGPSWSLGFTAGADLVSADPAATKDDGSMKLLDAAVVRSGTGSISVAAGHDLVLAGAGSVLYTAGEDLGAGQFAEAEGLGPDASTYDSAFFSAYAPGLVFAGNGGDLSIRVGRDIIGPVDDEVEPLTAQTTNQWLFKFGTDLGEAYDLETGEPLPNVNVATGVVPVVWGVAPTEFRQNIGALGGGRVDIEAGRDLVHVSANLPTSGRQVGSFDLDTAGIAKGTFNPFAGDTSQIDEVGGGMLNISAGRNVLGGTFYVQKGQARIRANGQIGTGTLDGNAPLLSENPIVALGDADFEVWSRGDATLDAIVNPTQFAQDEGQADLTRLLGFDLGLIGSDPSSQFISRFTTYSDSSAVELQSLSGDLRLFNNANRATRLNTFDWEGTLSAARTAASRYPASLRLVASSGSIDLRVPSDVINSSAYLVQPDLEPRAGGDLNLLAAKDIVSNPIGIVFQPDFDRNTLPTVLQPTAQLDSLRVNQLQRGSEPVYATNQDPNYVVAANGDIVDLGINLSKQTRLLAGRDIVDLRAEIQHSLDGAMGEDLTLIEAGRDIRFNARVLPTGEVIVAVGNTRGIVVSGDGQVNVLAGGDISLGDSRGIVTIGDRTELGDGQLRGRIGNANLSQTGADILVMAGLTRQPNYEAFLEHYVFNPDSQPQRWQLLIAFPGADFSPDDKSALTEGLFDADADFWVVGASLGAGFADSVGRDTFVIEVERKAELTGDLAAGLPLSEITAFAEAFAGSPPQVEIVGGPFNYVTAAWDYVAQKLLGDTLGELTPEEALARLPVDQALDYLRTTDPRQNLDFIANLYFSELVAGGQRAALEQRKVYFDRSKDAVDAARGASRASTRFAIEAYPGAALDEGLLEIAQDYGLIDSLTGQHVDVAALDVRQFGLDPSHLDDASVATLEQILAANPGAVIPLPATAADNPAIAGLERVVPGSAAWNDMQGAEAATVDGRETRVVAISETGLVSDARTGELVGARLFPGAPTADSPYLVIDPASNLPLRTSIESVQSQSPFQGDLAAIFSRISPEDGGNVQVLAPGGSYLVGSLDQPRDGSGNPVETGLVVPKAGSGGGNVQVMTAVDISVNASKVVNRASPGNMVMWASVADIAAGRGERSARVSARPFDVDLVTGTRIPNDTPVIQGSGIQNRPPSGGVSGNTYLLTEIGKIDAGTAGIAADSITLVAEVIQNPEAFFTAGEIGAAPEAPPPVPVLTSAGDGDEASRSAIEDVIETLPATGAGQSSGEEQLAMLSVEFLGFGEERPLLGLPLDCEDERNIDRSECL